MHIPQHSRMLLEKRFGTITGWLYSAGKALAVLMLVLWMLLLNMAMPQDLVGRVEFTHAAYRIGPGDVLSFSVYNQSDLTQKEILVRSDGMASFNGAGELPVSGRTISDIKQMLEERLGELIIDPLVTVTVSNTKPGTIYLSGAVKHPGMYQLSTGNQTSANSSANSNPITRIDLRLSNILSNAGGVTINADLSNVQVKRQTPDGEYVISLDLWKMLKEGDNSQDIMLLSGDAIHIPNLENMAIDNEDYALVLSSSIGPEKFPVRVIGALEKPGIYELQGESPFLNSAIAVAGGYKDGADQKIVAIRRFTRGADVSTLYVDPRKQDIVLRPNDIVYVAEKKLHKTGRFFSTVNDILKPFTDTAFSAGMLSNF